MYMEVMIKTLTAHDVCVYVYIYIYIYIYIYRQAKEIFGGDD